MLSRKQLANTLLAAFAILLLSSCGSREPGQSAGGIQRQDGDALQFDGETYVLQQKEGDAKGALNEYVRAGEDLESWTRMIAVRTYPHLNDRSEAVANLARELKKQNPLAPFKLYKPADGSPVMIIDFTTWDANGTVVEFNYFAYQDNPHGKGLLSHQFAMCERGNENDLREFMLRLKTERPRILELLSEFVFPEICE